MSIEQMRAVLKYSYGNNFKWCQKVDKMSDAQVLAIYHRKLNDGSLKYDKTH